MSAPNDAQVAAGRVDRLLEQLRSGPDPRAAAVAEELVRCLVQLYGAGLERIVAIVGEQGNRDLCADPLVESLMLVHDLHPLDAGTRIRRALEAARPHLGDLEYAGIDDGGVAHIRMPGGHHGCRSSVRQAIESAVREAAPELAGVAVEAGVAPPALLSIRRRPGLGAVR
jgi:Fe-S cluster biogenesis protein NfuA